MILCSRKLGIVRNRSLCNFGNWAKNLESGFDDSISLQSRDEDIKDPEEHENSRGDGFDRFGATQFTAHGRVTTEEQNDNGQESLDTEHSHGESQAARGNLKNGKVKKQLTEKHLNKAEKELKKQPIKLRFFGNFVEFTSKARPWASQ